MYVKEGEREGNAREGRYGIGKGREEVVISR